MKRLNMTISLTQTQLIRARKTIINIDINAQIKAYQKQLVILSFEKKNVSKEYHSILDKIKLLRLGKLKGKLPEV
jgi:hypothetical protein